MVPPAPHSLEWVTSFCSPISSPAGTQPGLERKGPRHRSAPGIRRASAWLSPSPCAHYTDEQTETQSHAVTRQVTGRVQFLESGFLQMRRPQFLISPTHPPRPSSLRISTVKGCAAFLRRKLDHQSHEARGTLKIKEGKPRPASWVSVNEEGFFSSYEARGCTPLRESPPWFGLTPLVCGPR